MVRRTGSWPRLANPQPDTRGLLVWHRDRPGEHPGRLRRRDLRRRDLRRVGGTSAATGIVQLNTEPVNLVLWEQWGGSGPNAEAMTAVIDAYEASHPGITDRRRADRGTDNAKILTAISGGKPPFDMLDMGLGLFLGSWASKGALMPLEDFIQRSNLDTSLYVRLMLQAMQVSGKQYALPFMGFNNGLIYNKKLFEAAGLDPNKPPTEHRGAHGVRREDDQGRAKRA